VIPSAAPSDAAIVAEKAAIRAASLARRDALDPEMRRSASQAFAERGREVLGDVADKIVSGFWPIRSELDPRWLMRRLAEGGAKLALPSIEGGALVFRAFAFGDRLRRAGFGLSEPHDDAELVTPDIMLVPLAAFDRKGGRIGYGKGYYDGAISRFAAAGRRPRLLGLAFSCQETPFVPLSPHDQMLEAILTEDELIHTGAPR
jgi:5-formyltetrahydrofolate cyclo-ligase